MSISVQLSEKFGQRLVRLDPQYQEQETTALYYLWHISSNILIRDKGITGVKVRLKPSSAQRFWAACATSVKSKTSEIRMSPSALLKDNWNLDPMQMIWMTLHIGAHEICHHVAYQTYGSPTNQRGRGHGDDWQYTMNTIFGIDGKRCINGEYCNTQIPQFSNRQEVLWDLYDLYSIWRLEQPDWNHPICKKLLPR